MANLLVFQAYVTVRAVMIMTEASVCWVQGRELPACGCRHCKRVWAPPPAYVRPAHREIAAAEDFRAA
jgi:hypothetical protein